MGIKQICSQENFHPCRVYFPILRTHKCIINSCEIRDDEMMRNIVEWNFLRKNQHRRKQHRSRIPITYHHYEFNVLNEKCKNCM